LDRTLGSAGFSAREGNDRGGFGVLASERNFAENTSFGAIMKRACVLCATAALTVGLAAPGAASAWTVKQVNANVGCGSRAAPGWGRPSSNSFEGTVRRIGSTVSLSGWLWNRCPGGGNAQVWVSWWGFDPVLLLAGPSALSWYNTKVGPTAGVENRIVQIGGSNGFRIARPSGLTVTVCSTYRQWHCGTPMAL
jgi:hypothetical protein